MKENELVNGRQSILFPHAPYILSSASIAGKKESEGPMAKFFDDFLKPSSLRIVH